MHKAYTFDPDFFHHWLEEKIVKNKKVDQKALLELASETVTDALPEALEVLKFLRFDTEWLDDTDEAASLTDEWYIITLTKNLSPTFSLSNRLTASYCILEAALPEIGWSENEVKELVRGKRLRTLIESSDISSLISEFTGLDQFGRWLSLNDAKLLRAKLETVKEKFLFPEKKLLQSLSLDSYISINKLNPAFVIKEAWNDAIDMLDSSISSNKALFLILD